MDKKDFHTQTERKGNYEIRYIAGEDFVEMGSIDGEQYLSALYFCKIYEESYSGELGRKDIKFIEESVNDFVTKYGFTLGQKYPHYDTAALEFYHKFGWNKFDSMLVTIFSDYHCIWIKLEEISHQTFYPEHHHYFLIDADTLMYGIEQFKQLSNEFKTENFDE